MPHSADPHLALARIYVYSHARRGIRRWRSSQTRRAAGRQARAAGDRSSRPTPTGAMRGSELRLGTAGGAGTRRRQARALYQQIPDFDQPATHLQTGARGYQIPAAAAQRAARHAQQARRQPPMARNHGAGLIQRRPPVRGRRARAGAARRTAVAGRRFAAGGRAAWRGLHRQNAKLRRCRTRLRLANAEPERVAAPINCCRSRRFRIATSANWRRRRPSHSWSARAAAAQRGDAGATCAQQRTRRCCPSPSSSRCWSVRTPREFRREFLAVVGALLRGLLSGVRWPGARALPRRPRHFCRRCTCSPASA